MEVRISFRAEVTISGNTLEEIVEKWADLDLFSKDAKACKAEYVELDRAEDTDNYNDYSNEF